MEFDDDRLRFTLNIDGEYKIVALDPNQTLGLPTDTWLHIAGPYDGKFLKIYLNSILINSIPETGLIYYLYNNALLFGVDAGSGIYPGPYLEYFLMAGWMKSGFGNMQGIQQKSRKICTAFFLGMKMD